MLYENVEEFRNFYPEKELVSNWRNGQEGQWVMTDDLQVCKILRRSTMDNRRGRTIDYVRTILGTYTTNPNVDMGGLPPKNVYSFSNKKFSKKLREERKEPTNNEFLICKVCCKGNESHRRLFTCFSYK